MICEFVYNMWSWNILCVYCLVTQKLHKIKATMSTKCSSHSVKKTLQIVIGVNRHWNSFWNSPGYVSMSIVHKDRPFILICPIFISFLDYKTMCMMAFSSIIYLWMCYSSTTFKSDGVDTASTINGNCVDALQIWDAMVVLDVVESVNCTL